MTDGKAFDPPAAHDIADFDRLVAYYAAVAEDCVASVDEATMDRAVARFVAPVDAAYADSSEPEQAVETILWAAWTALIDKAGESDAPRSHSLLIELMARIGARILPDRPDRDGDLRVYGLRVYADLPVFGAQMREAWDASRQGPDWPQAWVNLNAFAARLTAAGVDFSLYALWTLRECLEDDQTPDSDLLTAAAAWLTHCGPPLAAHAAAGYSLTQWGAAARVGPLGVERGIAAGGFSPQRWTFWGARLQELANASCPAALEALAAFQRCA